MELRYSHPADRHRDAVPLKDHLEDVAGRVREIIPDDAATVSDGSMVDLVERLGYIHDFGKATTWFQQHIGILDGEPKGVPTHHSPLGAVLAYYVLDCVGFEGEDCLAGYVAVARHHGTIPDVPEFVFRRTAWNRRRPAENELQEEVIRQVKNIDSETGAFATDMVALATHGTGSWSEFSSAVTDRSLFDRIKHQVSPSGFDFDPAALSPSFYPCLLQAWSALALADKTSAAHVPRSGYASVQPDRAVLASFIDGLPTDGEALSEREQQLNAWREAARNGVLENVSELAGRNATVATITLPTGMGKTLTGLDAALTHRDMTNRDRVVYALPFTSIIDQVDHELRSIFDTNARDGLLTVHHHLSDTVIELDDDLEGTDERALLEEMLGESWRSGIVLTTYVQLFESLVGPRNTQSMKLPALYNSVIVLDEPQGLPHDWWQLVSRLITVLTEEFHATVIAMTATQPRILGSETDELVDDWESYYHGIERVEYRIDDSVDSYTTDTRTPIGYDEAAQLISSVIEESDDDILAICNTIDSAQQLTHAIHKHLDGTEVGTVLDRQLTSTNDDVIPEELANHVVSNDGSVALLHLSTRIRPKDRRLLLEAASSLLESDTQLVTISTQLVEAGVDISFDRVYRDLAPLDSVVQAAGRCNRSFEQEQGTVTIWWLDVPGEQLYTPAEAVYDRWGESLLRVTINTLDELEITGGTVEETIIALEGVTEYFRKLTEDRDIGRREYVSYMDESLGDELASLSLIEQREAVDVVITRIEDEHHQVEMANAAWERSDFNQVDELLGQLAEARVSIPIYTDDSNEAEVIRSLPKVHPDSDLRWLDVSLGRGSPYFNPSHGILIPDSTVEGRFL